MKKNILIPITVDLKKINGWKQLDEKGKRFCVVRFHCTLTRYNSKTGRYYGEPIEVFGFPEQLKGKSSFTRTIKVKTVSTEESIKQTLIENLTFSKIASTIAAKLEAPLFGEVSSEIKSELSEQIKNEFLSSFSITNVIEREEQETHEIEINFDLGKEQSAYAVKEYSRCRYELWLGFIDYLFITYEGIRSRRQKLPPGTYQEHRNFFPFKKPLAAIHFWKPIGNSLILVPRDYKKTVRDPTEITVHKLTLKRPPIVKRIKEPSLYAISEKVFPRRWSELNHILKEGKKIFK